MTKEAADLISISKEVASFLLRVKGGMIAKDLARDLSKAAIRLEQSLRDDAPTP